LTTAVAQAVAARRNRLLERMATELEAERDRWMLWLPVAFGLGIAGYFGLAGEPVAGTAPLLLAVALLLVLLLRQRQAPLIGSIALAVAAAGFAAAQLRSDLVAAPILASETGPRAITGRILAIEASEQRPRVVLHRLTVSGLSEAETPDRVRLRLATVGSRDLRPGDWLRVVGVLRPPPQPSVPGGFDFARRAYFQGLGAVGYALGRAESIAVPAAYSEARATQWLAEWRLWWAGWRAAVAERVRRQLQGDTGALAIALMTGDRSALSESLVESMRDSGLAHLLAISGLHMGLVAGILFFATRAALALLPGLALRFPIKKWAAVAALSGAFAYLNLSGATIPTQRAFVMVSLVLLAVLVDRTAISLRSVALAALLVLLLTPEALVSASFQLSFAAVVALVAAYEALTARFGPGRFSGSLTRPASYVAGMALTSVIATAATTPFVIFHFNRLAVFGLAANLVAVPTTAFWIMPCALLAFALMPLGWEGPLLWLMGLGLDLVIAVAEAVAAWPGAVLAVPAMPVAGLAAAAAGGLWLCLWRRGWRLLGLPLLLAGLSSPLAGRPPDLLIGGDAQLFGLHEPGRALWLSSRRREGFAADQWMRRLGLTPGELRSWGPGEPAASGDLLCDSLGCLVRRGSHRVALLRDPRGLADDCRLASLLISWEPLRRADCPGPGLIIDRFDLWRRGAHAIWLSGPEPRVETVAGRQGDRPWSLERQRAGSQ